MHLRCRPLGFSLVLLLLLFNLLHIGTSSSSEDNSLDNGTDPTTNDAAKEKKLGKGKQLDIIFVSLVSYVR